jgi:uncharacterized phage protein (predicted DNA packaging)
MQLVALDDVKSALRIDHSDQDPLLDLHILAASAAVAAYMKDNVEPYLDTAGEAMQEIVPGDVRNATILLVAALFEGDPIAEFADSQLPRAVKALLTHYRDPTLA